MKPRVLMLAGPNGAGKSTFFTTYLADKGLPFVNADRIAAELDLGAYEAAEVAESARDRLVNVRKSFITGTVLSDPVGARLKFLLRARAAGYEVTLIYIGLANAELAVRRVEARVRQGGHDVPLEKVLAGYERSLTNLEQAIRPLPRVILYDNSSSEEPYRFFGEFRRGDLHERAKGKISGWARGFLGKR